MSCEIASPIACGSMVRLEHVGTGKNLHSHLFKAPLSGNQEVSAFGDGGNGDTGDNWIIVCESGQLSGNRGASFYLKHADTGKYLYTDANSAKFNQQNCGGGCPIMVSCKGNDCGDSILVTTYLHY
jgi:dolichyl-phosphate-mannose--protein O-mannosyl transferase